MFGSRAAQVRAWSSNHSHWSTLLVALGMSACAAPASDEDSPGFVEASRGGASAGASGSASNAAGSASLAGTGSEGGAAAGAGGQAGKPQGGGDTGGTVMNGGSGGSGGTVVPGGGGSAGTTGGSAGCGLSPADPEANSKAKNLLCYLKTHTNISGQTDLGDGDKVKGMTGRYPAIIAFDFYRYTDGDTSQTQAAIDFFKKKRGIVAFQWHWKAPPGGDYYTDWDFPSALGDPNSKLHQDVHLVVSELKKMGDAGVPVLFRPLHECNNNFMWWARHGADNYKKLWKIIFDEAQQVGAHNVVWVFNGMASKQSTPMSDWYPGDGQADVVGSDYFQSPSDYDTLQKIGSGKVISIPETFNALVPDKDPAFNYFVVWASRDWGGKGAEDSWKASMNNPKTISIDQLPDMSQW
ncbi:MAG TPA: glycosyl hydrolase [Polyangiaceae bacterium]|nr:glycosyl hydrolase [Polyangiaceae bacterium]